MWVKNSKERRKNAFHESSKYQELSQHWGPAKSLMVPVCYYKTV
ncbi:hypothetical protein [Bartonella harrusi]|nr:hypothetical protein [Bartonella harrusi]